MATIQTWKCVPRKRNRSAGGGLSRRPTQAWRKFSQAYGWRLYKILSFKYLQRVLTMAYNYWTLVVSNLSKARQK